MGRRPDGDGAWGGPGVRVARPRPALPQRDDVASLGDGVYRSPRARRRFPMGRVLAVVAAALCVRAGVTMIGGVVLTNRFDSSIKRGNLSGGARATPGANVRGPLNFLLIGSNFRTEDPSNGERADTIMVVRVSRDLSRAYLVSVPRDLYYTIKPYPPTRYKGSTEKIDAALNFGGMPLMAQTAPWQALDYVRQRERLPGGDFDRQRHQQQFLMAVLKQTASAGTLSDPIKLDRVLRAIGQALTVDTNGTSAPDFVFRLRGIKPESLVGLKAPAHPETTGGTSYVVGEPDLPELWSALRTDMLDSYAAAHAALVNPLRSGVPAGQG